MTRAARMIQTANFPETRSRRRIPSPARTAQLAISFDGDSEHALRLPFRSLSSTAPGNAVAPERAPGEARAAAAALAADPATPSRCPSDWTGLQEGAREVFATLMATIAIGLAWAAIEAGQRNAELASSPAVSDRESR